MTNEQLAVLLESYKIMLEKLVMDMNAQLVDAGFEQHQKWEYIGPPEQAEAYMAAIHFSVIVKARFYEEHPEAYERLPTGEVIALDGLRNFVALLGRAIGDLRGK